MSNTKILKNPTTVTVSTNSYGKIFTINPKSSLTIQDSQADQIAQDLLYRYGFLRDITPKPTVVVDTVLVPGLNKKGRRINTVKKIVKKAKGVTR